MGSFVMNTKTWKSCLLRALWPALALAAACLPGCSNAPAQAPNEDKRLKVDVSTPIVAEVSPYEDFVGRVDAANKVAIKAMVTGYLIRRNFVDGQEVEKGRLLFEIDPKMYQAKYDLALATLLQAQARFERLTGDYERGQQLVPKYMSKEDFEKVRGDRLEAQASVGQAKAQLEQARVNLAYTKVTAEFSGKISRRLIDDGNMVIANETVLTTLYAIDPMYGYFDVDERSAIAIRRLVNEGKMPQYYDGKMHVEVGLADEERFSLRGTIDFIDQVLDAGTGMQRMRCVIPQPRTKVLERPPLALPFGTLINTPALVPAYEWVSKPQILVSPGMFVRVRLPVGVPHSQFLIAERAVGAEQGKKFINIVNAEGKVERRYVELGQMYHGLRVVAAATDSKLKLEKTDKVIMNNLQRLAPGKEVVATVINMPQYTPPTTTLTALNGHGK
jgi:membrane fusion protein, multidrug efflux system